MVCWPRPSFQIRKVGLHTLRRSKGNGDPLAVSAGCPSPDAASRLFRLSRPGFEDDFPRQAVCKNLADRLPLAIALLLLLITADHLLAQGIHLLLIGFQSGQILELSHQKDVEIVWIVRFSLQNLVGEAKAVGLERLLFAFPIGSQVGQVSGFHSRLYADESDVPHGTVPVWSGDLGM